MRGHASVSRNGGLGDSVRILSGTRFFSQREAPGAGSVFHLLFALPMRVRLPLQVEQQLADTKEQVSAREAEVAALEQAAKETELQTHVAAKEQQAQIATLQKEIIRCVRARAGGVGLWSGYGCGIKKSRAVQVGW